jgi:hypothetical protein
MLCNVHEALKSIPETVPRYAPVYTESSEYMRGEGLGVLIKINKVPLVNATNRNERDTLGDGAEFLTKDELAKLLKLKRRGIECLVFRRVIPVIRLSRRVVRFNLKAVINALAQYEIREIGRKKL